jgi:hypothetical protein
LISFILVCFWYIYSVFALNIIAEGYLKIRIVQDTKIAHEILEEYMKEKQLSNSHHHPTLRLLVFFFPFSFWLCTWKTNQLNAANLLGFGRSIVCKFAITQRHFEQFNNILEKRMLFFHSIWSLSIRNSQRHFNECIHLLICIRHTLYPFNSNNDDLFFFSFSVQLWKLDNYKEWYNRWTSRFSIRYTKYVSIRMIISNHDKNTSSIDLTFLLRFFLWF